MRRSRYLVALAATGTIAAGLAACGSTSSSSSSAGQSPASASAGSGAGTSGAPTPAGLTNSGPVCQKGATIGFSLPLPDPNFTIFAQVVRADLSAAGYHVVVTQANLDPGKQISDINSLIAQGAKALITNPVDPRSMQPQLNRLRSMHIPVIVQDTRIGGPYTTDVTSTVENAAADGARLLKQNVGSGEVTAMDGPQGIDILDRERNAFVTTAKAAGLNVVGTQTNTNDTPDTARQLGSVWKVRYGSSLKGVWTFGDTSAAGIASLVGNGFNPKIVSVNGEPEIIPLIKQGKVLATYWLELPKIAHVLAWTVEQSLCGKSLPPQIYLPLKLITAGNVSQWLAPAVQAKQPFGVKLAQRGGRWTVANF